MPEPFAFTAGLWWRHDRYEIRDGRICPRRGARLEQFDPWAEYLQGAPGPDRTGSRYQTLLAMLEGLTITALGERNQYSLVPASENEILAWCQTSGLLGVLLQRTQAVFLAPRWEPMPFIGEVQIDAPRPGDGSRLVPVLRRYFRFNLGWRETYSVTFGEGAVALDDEPEQEGQVVHEKFLPEDWPRPGAELQRLTQIEWNHEPLGQTWARFFPGVPKDQEGTYAYPLPMSERFWEQYAEPVEAFLEGAKTLWWAAKDLSKIKPANDLTDDDARDVRRGIKALQALVAPVSAAIEPREDGTLRQRWVAPSLLGSLAMMLLQDLTEQKRILECEVCGKLSVSSSPRARYCSDRCRQTAQKRRYRARKRDTMPGRSAVSHSDEVK